MNNNLKEIRINALGLSEKDLAQKLGMSLDEYKRLEAESVKKNQVEMALLIKLSQATGVSLDNLVNVTKAKVEFKIDDNWNSVKSFRDNFNTYIKQHEGLFRSDNYFIKKINELSILVNRMARKPRVALVGRSDVGKSTLINALIDSNVLPQEWTPTTSIIMYVKHVDDRPDFCKENVMIFKSDSKGALWDDTRLYEEGYTTPLCIAQGDYLLLREYGARQGKNFNQTSASSAVVFINSPILKNCDFIDLPGYGTSDREEDDSMLASVKEIDVLLYLSIANGFMRGEDINWLQQEMVNLAPITLNSDKLKPLSNLYIIASQAHTIQNGSHEQLKLILTKAAERFESTLSDGYWKNLGQNATPADFRKRFFTFDTDQESLRKDFENDFKNLLTVLPNLILANLKKMTADFLGKTEKEIKASKSQFEKILNNRTEQREAYRKASDEAPNKLSELESQKAHIVNLIDTEYRRGGIIAFTHAYNRIMTKESIVAIIKKNGWKNKSEDKKAICSKISNLLNEEYLNSIKGYSEEFSDCVNSLLDNFENNISDGPIKDLNVDSGFDVKGTFAGGLVGVAAYGALAMWAVGLGNLGAYILVAKGVSLLAAMGISVGGTAAGISAISLIGGPVVVAIGIAALIAIVISWIFGSSWEERLAKNIIKEYDKKNGLGQFKNAIEKYWDDTKSAFIKAVNNLRDSYVNYLDELGEKTKVDDTQIMNQIKNENNKLDFISKLLNQIEK